MMLAAAEGAAEAGCSPGMGWALRRTYLLAWGLHIPADDSLSAPAGGEPDARLPMLRSCTPHSCEEGSVFTVRFPTARSRVQLRAGQSRRGPGRAAARLQSIGLDGRRRRVVRGAGFGHGGGAQKGADGGRLCGGASAEAWQGASPPRGHRLLLLVKLAARPAPCPRLRMWHIKCGRNVVGRAPGSGSPREMRARVHAAL